MKNDLICEGLEFSFDNEPKGHRVLSGLNAQFYAGKISVVTGASGSGKTTLLSLLGLVVRPDLGQIKLGDLKLTGRSSTYNDRFRRNHVGMIFQTSRLIPTFTVEDQIKIVQMIRGSNTLERVMEVIDRLDMLHSLEKYPHELSGGEKQKVAMAQCLGLNVKIILADEPSASTDSDTASSIFDILSDYVSATGATAVVTSHDPIFIKRADQLLRL